MCEVETDQSTVEEKPEPIAKQSNAPIGEDQSTRLRATIYVLIFALNVVFYQSLSKKATDEMGVAPIDVSLLCRTMTLCVSIIVILREKKRPIGDLDFSLLPTLIVRSISGTISFTGMFFAVHYLPVFIAQIVMNMGPFWATIFGYFINNETPNVF